MKSEEDLLEIKEEPIETEEHANLNAVQTVTNGNNKRRIQFTAG